MANITIYEIAEAVGVSASTVSRVINDKPNINKNTKKRVMDYLAKCNYVPNEAARNLVNKSTKTIGVLLSDIRTSHHTDGIFYIQRELDEQGYNCLIMNTGHDNASKARYIQLLSQRRVEAAVFIGSTFQTDEVQEAIRVYLHNIPIFIINGYLDLPNVYGIIADERNGVTDCMRLLAESGKTRTAFFVDYQTPSNLLKIEGYKDGVRRHCQGDAYVVECGIDFQSIYDTTVRLLREQPQINGIMCAEDSVAASVLRALHDCKKNVPEEIGVIGINNSTISKILLPTLTSLDNMQLDLCVTAAHNLASVLQGRHVVRKMMIFSQVVRREST